jgi:hypothetical protein
MNKLIALAALFGMTTGLAGASEHPFADWDRIESEVSPTGYVAEGGTPVEVQAHAFADWDRIESALHPTGHKVEGHFAAGDDRQYSHPGVGDQIPGAEKIGNLEYNN